MTALAPVDWAALSNGLKAKDGFESMPEALSRLYEGKNMGVQCCRVRPEPPRPEGKDPALA